MIKKKSILSYLYLALIGLIIIPLAVALGLILRGNIAEYPRNLVGALNRELATAAAIVPSPYIYTFDQKGTLAESPASEHSSSPYWWLNSGGLLYLREGTGQTVHGSLPMLSRWRLAYAASNPLDTDDGYHPQNLIRLVTRSTWENVRTQVEFKIDRTNLSKSPNRNASNGLLFFNRYQDSNNLYYTGVRVDGAAVIKKKYLGKYYTMAYRPIFSGTPYQRENNPNLLPERRWIGMRSEVKTNSDGTVAIKLFTRTGDEWILIAHATDDGISFGGPPITAAGYGGIRTDFMDVTFENYRMETI